MSRSPASDRLLVWAVVASQFGPPFMFSGVAVALPAMGEHLRMSATELGLVETTFLAGGTAFLLPAGKLADAMDRRSLFRWSLGVFALLTLAIGLVSSSSAILLLRFLQGAASAVCAATGPAILVELVPPQRLGRVFGAVLGTAYAGLSVGPLAAGWIVSRWGWRAVFLFGAGLILCGGLPVFLRLRSRWRWPGRWVHWPSLVLLVTAALAAVSGSAGLGYAPWGALALAVGVSSLAAFVWLQLRISDPLLDLRELARNAPLSRALVVQLLLYLNAYCAIFMLSVFLQVTRGYPAPQTGLILASGSLVMACVAPLSGRLSDRVRPQRVATCGLVAVAFSSALGMRLHQDSGAWQVAGVLLAQGLGFGLFSSPNLAIIMGSMEARRSGLASALAAQSRGIGMFCGMAVTAALIALDFGSEPVAESPERFAGTLHVTYTVLMASSSLALAMALVGRRRSRAALG